LLKTAQNCIIFAKNLSKRINFCKKLLKTVRKRFENNPYFTFSLRKTPEKSPLRAASHTPGPAEMLDFTPGANGRTICPLFIRLPAPFFSKNLLVSAYKISKIRAFQPMECKK